MPSRFASSVWNIQSVLGPPNTVGSASAMGVPAPPSGKGTERRTGGVELMDEEAPRTGRNSPRKPGEFLGANSQSPRVRHKGARRLRRRAQARYPLAPDVFRATAARMRVLNAFSFTFSPSRKSMARLVFPSRLELKRLAGSFRDAPLAKVSFTTLL